MEAKNVLLFFLFLGTISSRVFATGEDSTSRSGYFITRENKRLIGYVVKRFESASFMSCSQSCVRNAWCDSTNFKVSSEKDGKGTCELNKHSSSLIDENTELYEQQGATFSLLLKVRLLSARYSWIMLSKKVQSEVKFLRILGRLEIRGDRRD